MQRVSQNATAVAGQCDRCSANSNATQQAKCSVCVVKTRDCVFAIKVTRDNRDGVRAANSGRMLIYETRSEVGLVVSQCSLEPKHRDAGMARHPPGVQWLLYSRADSRSAHG